MNRALNILIAEDDKADMFLMQAMFEKSRMFEKVTFVSDGKMLLDYINDEGNQKPDIILSDINMPVMNGFEAITEILNHTGYKNIPVIIYSTSDNPCLIAKGMKLGIKSYIIKPYNFEEFEKLPGKIVRILND